MSARTSTASWCGVSPTRPATPFFSVPNQIIRFFQDDNVSGQLEAQSGFVDFIRVYDAALTPTQVAVLENPIVVPAFDQRGAPFARLRDGDGVGGAQIDIGAYELQAFPAPTALDFGDAPDTSASTGPGNYNTLASDNGASHGVVAGLRMGTNVDGDNGTLQNVAANADDVNGALPDDEDGLSNPAADLVLVAGTQPTLNVRVTNPTGMPATLYGWIDYNANGMFDNATERASVAVPNGTNNGVVQLVFPAVPESFIGTTYARFRLSTGAAAANPTGAAADGEVEDYAVTIAGLSSGAADSAKNRKIASGIGPGPFLADGNHFGISSASLGDLDGDGVNDLAVGGDENALHVLFMNDDGTVKSSQQITNNLSAGFGQALAGLGDLDGDGVVDLAVARNTIALAEMSVAHYTSCS